MRKIIDAKNEEVLKQAIPVGEALPLIHLARFMEDIITQLNLRGVQQAVF
jgi:hypothetical protein